MFLLLYVISPDLDWLCIYHACECMNLLLKLQKVTHSEFRWKDIKLSHLNYDGANPVTDGIKINYHITKYNS